MVSSIVKLVPLLIFGKKRVQLDLRIHRSLGSGPLQKECTSSRYKRIASVGLGPAEEVWLALRFGMEL